MALGGWFCSNLRAWSPNAKYLRWPMYQGAAVKWGHDKLTL